MIDDDDGEKQSAVYIAVRLISVERESVCVQNAKERFGSSLYFRAIGQKSDESHYIFSLSSSALSLARRKAHKKRFETRANERVDLQKQNIFVVVCCRLLSPSVVSSSSFERARKRSTLDTLKRVSRSVFLHRRGFERSRSASRDHSRRVIHPHQRRDAVHAESIK